MLKVLPNARDCDGLIESIAMVLHSHEAVVRTITHNDELATRVVVDPMRCAEPDNKKQILAKELRDTIRK